MGGGGGMLPDFLFCSFSLFSRPRAGLATVSSSSFFELATNTLNVRNNNNNCALTLIAILGHHTQHFSPPDWGCSEGLIGAF